MEIINCDNIGGLIQRTLNYVDPRLIDHGLRVAYIVSRMLDVQNKYTRQERQDICLLTLLHDVGAYKTEEIDRMIQFETKNIWEHSVYGYLFIRYMTPLSELAPAILYHHLDFIQLEKMDVPCWEIAQMINLADRADIFLEGGQEDTGRFEDFLNQSEGKRFSPETVSLYRETAARSPFRTRIQEEIDIHEILNGDFLCRQKADAFLKMLIYTIDFRSRFTVTHTLATATISEQLALLLGYEGEDLEHVVYGAMLHDLGKIGIPVEILESGGRLETEEMRIMKTHVDITEEILRGCVDETTRRIALRHHEKLNGGGYPRGLRAEELTQSERIVAVGDILSALCGTRSYKQAFSQEKTISLLEGMAQNGLIDADIVALAVGNFDRLMEKLQEAEAPVLEAYHLIQEEYTETLRRLSERGQLARG